MLSSSEIVLTVRDALQRHNLTNLVVDPVMVATTGAKLLNDNATRTIKEALIPLALVLTPNIYEAELLTGLSIDGIEQMEQAAREAPPTRCPQCGRQRWTLDRHRQMR